MADPRAFISYDFDHDDTNKMLFAGQIKNSKTPFTVQDWSNKAPLPQSTWEATTEAKINSCNMVIVLVGTSMASASGVVKEIAMAKANDVPVFGVYVGGATTTSSLPTGLARNRTISWNWDDIAAAVTQMTGEGKNKKS